MDDRPAPLIYRHDESTRRPIVLAAALLGGAMGFIGWRYGAPFAFLIVTAASTLFAFAWLIDGRRSGCRIDTQTAFFFAGRWSASFPMADIRGYRLTPWSNSRPWVYLCLEHGQDWLVPAYCIGDVEAFVEALARVNRHRLVE